MSRTATGQAIGKVTKLLSERLDSRTGFSVTVGRPNEATSANGAAVLNLFLYEAGFDPSLRNLPLDPGQMPPLWLVLKYLITALDTDGNSDTIEAHETLGEGLRALQELNFLDLAPPLPPDIPPALEDNPEPLKITFDEMPADLLAQLMQGPDEQYRFSMGFQVRPVLIVPADPPAYSLMVGVDYTQTPAVEIGADGVRIPVLPSLGPRLTAVRPDTFETEQTLMVEGEELHLEGLVVRLGPATLAVTSQRPDRLQCVVNGVISDGSVLSAGHHGLTVEQTLATGRVRSSNPVVAGLRPTLTDAIPQNLALNADGRVFGAIDLEGVLLGTDDDDAFVALYADGRVARLFDEFTAPPGPPSTPQTRRRVPISSADAVPPGDYVVLLRVNGLQAPAGPVVRLVV